MPHRQGKYEQLVIIDLEDKVTVTDPVPPLATSVYGQAPSVLAGTFAPNEMFPDPPIDHMLGAFSSKLYFYFLYNRRITCSHRSAK